MKVWGPKGNADPTGGELERNRDHIVGERSVRALKELTLEEHTQWSAQECSRGA